MQKKLLETQTIENITYNKIRFTDNGLKAIVTTEKKEESSKVARISVILTNQDKYLHINIYTINSGFMQPIEEVGVNWSAYGTTNITETAEFIKELIFANKVADYINKNIL